MTVCMISFLYWPYSFFVKSRILLYLFALATIKLTVQMVYTFFDLEFPKFLTSIHILTSACFGFSILLYRRQTVGESIKVPAAAELLWLLPLALSFCYSLGANNMALTFCSTSFTEMVGAATPLSTVALMLVLGAPFNMWLLAPTMVVLCGCWMA